jgi:hypothetical protein
MKICRDCKESKDESLFIKNRGFKNGVDTLCKSCNLRRVREWRVSGKRDSAKESSLYYSRHTGKCVSRVAKYRAKKIQAIPKWLTKDDLSFIETLYSLSKSKTYETGIRWEVDHILPLNGELVCGLHVPANLQLLPKTENAKKSNKLGY